MPAHDFTVIDVAALMENFGSHAEHEGYLEQLEKLNLSDETDARQAIQEWLVPAFNAEYGRTKSGQERMRESLRVVISRWGFLPHGPWLPGINLNIVGSSEPAEIYSRARRFYRLLWDELFHEPLEPITDTDTLRERSDIPFDRAPGQPERWGSAPQYRSLTYWDEMLIANAWRENWPANRG